MIGESTNPAAARSARRSPRRRRRPACTTRTRTWYTRRLRPPWSLRSRMAAVVAAVAASRERSRTRAARPRAVAGEQLRSTRPRRSRRPRLRLPRRRVPSPRPTAGRRRPRGLAPRPPADSTACSTRPAGDWLACPTQLPGGRLGRSSAIPVGPPGSGLALAQPAPTRPRTRGRRSLPGLRARSRPVHRLRRGRRHERLLAARPRRPWPVRRAPGQVPWRTPRAGFARSWLRSLLPRRVGRCAAGLRQRSGEGDPVRAGGRREREERVRGVGRQVPVDELGPELWLAWRLRVR